MANLAGSRTRHILLVAALVACATPRRGSLEKSVIRDVVRSHRAEVSACYEHEALENPSLGGRLKIKFIISASGDVSEIEVVSSELQSPALERCVIELVRTWVFPRPKGDGEVPVTYPLSFGQAIEVEQ